MYEHLNQLIDSLLLWMFGLLGLFIAVYGYFRTLSTGRSVEITLTVLGVKLSVAVKAKPKSDGG